MLALHQTGMNGQILHPLSYVRFSSSDEQTLSSYEQVGQTCTRVQDFIHFLNIQQSACALAANHARLLRAVCQ